jgi:hypothetical protein
MKTLRTAGRIFLGKNSGNLAERFRYHLIALVPLFIFTAVGLELRRIIERQAQAGQAIPPIENWLAAASDVTGVAALALAGYIMTLSLVLVIIGLLIKGTDEGDAPAR